MNTNMILSASGWRKIFAISNDEQDKTSLIGEENIALSVLAAKVFSDYLKAKTKKENPSVILGHDTRPTGNAICEACIKTFLNQKITVRFTGIIAAPEIMAYSKEADGFMYISASHNPIGHNGIKFGLNSGGVLNQKENATLTENFLNLTNRTDAKEYAFTLINGFSEKEIDEVYKNQKKYKNNALVSYKNFLLETISASKDKSEQETFFKSLKEKLKSKKIGVVCDFNGSARTVSVDKDFFSQFGINFYAINDKPGKIVHEIIPESENLIFVANEMENLQKKGLHDAVLGYMPDCDGDRGNIVYWDKNQKKSVILKAQEVFSLSVLSELLFSIYSKKENSCVCVNCPTSLRINEIAEKLNAKVFRSEVGEANVVNLAKEKRLQGFDARIFGEGSNGGTITYPSAVRDPINTIFAIIKLLSMDELFKIWCEKSRNQFTENYDITQIFSTLPEYKTTGVSEKRAVLKIKTENHGKLKRNFQKIFEEEWKNKKNQLETEYKISSFKVFLTNGTKEIEGSQNWKESQKGGLKIQFYDANEKPLAFFWMRGSGTESVFRILCDVKNIYGDIEKTSKEEKSLLEWETSMLLKADSQSL